MSPPALAPRAVDRPVSSGRGIAAAGRSPLFTKGAGVVLPICAASIACTSLRSSPPGSWNHSRGPDSVDPPSQSFQYGLAKPIPVASRSGAVIACPIAFDAQKVSPRLFAVHHRKVQKEAGAADLRLDLVLERRQFPQNLLLELRVRRPAGGAAHIHLPATGVVQESLQRRHARGGRLRKIDIVGAQ